MTKTVAILPCPFCGGMPSAYINLFERPHLLKCENPKCAARPSVNAHSPGEAILAWNQRGAVEPSCSRPFDCAAILGDAGERRISMRFETLAQYEAACVALGMADAPVSRTC